MAEPREIMMLTYEVFKPRAEARQAYLGDTYQDLVRNPMRFDINQLVECARYVAADSDLLNFTLGLLTIKVSHDSPLANGLGLDIFQWIEYFLNCSPDNAESIVNCYSSALIQEISNSDGNTLKSWAAIIARLEQRGANVEAPKKWLTIRFTSESYGLLTKMNQSPTKENIQSLITYISEIQEYSIDITSVKSMCLNAICEYIINENDLKGIRKQIGEAVNPDLEFAGVLLSRLILFSSVSAEDHATLDLIASKIEVLQPKKLPKVQKKAVVNENLNPFPGFDPALITFEEHPLCSRTSGRINVTIYRGTFPDGSMVVVKSYSAAGQGASLDDLIAVQEEIKILTIASNHATTDNCFIKFFGAGTQGKSIALYMEAHKHNLMDLISDWKGQNFKPDKEFLERWIISLVISFTELGNMKIAHGDIKPHNIIVTDDWKLKIIDFGISKIGQEVEATISQTGTYLIQGTRGYMAPEIEEMLANGQKSGNFKRGKADVFSLGMTILQILTYEDLTTLNMKQNNHQLLEKVAGLNANAWVKNMLTGMLVPDRKNRLSFNKCLRFLPASATTA